MLVAACGSSNGNSAQASTIGTGDGTPEGSDSGANAFVQGGGGSGNAGGAALADEDSGAGGFAGSPDGGSGAKSESGAAAHSGDAATGTGSLPPSQLPKRMLIGLEDNTGSWMTSSGVKWDVRWAYFTANTGSGWYNSFASGAPSTTWALGWMQSAVSQGYIPLIQYYVIQQDYQPTGDTGANLVNSSKTGKIQTAATVKDYFTKFKLLLTAAKQIGTPVIIVLEGDAFGFIEEQSNNDPSTYAAVADSGMPELAGLPNTVAGFGLAYLALRQSVGATNVIMGPDVPAYAANGDFLNYTTTDAIQPHVDYQYTSFFSKLGVGSNQTGSAYDFTATCPASADADQYAAYGDTGRWWDASDSASISSESFNRYAEWLTLFNQASKTPWVIWQIPMGNSNSPDVYNQEGAWAGPYASGYALPPGCASGSTSGCPGGYKDNRAEYFLGTERTQHLTKFAAAGVFGLFFGAGTGGASDQTDDYYTDGQLFMKSRGGALISAGGFPLN